MGKNMKEQIHKHKEILSLFDTMFEKKIITAFAGPINSDILTLVAENLEGSLWKNESLGKRFFRIFIELSQNIALYSRERISVKGKSFGAGIFIIRDYGKYFLFSAGNIISEDDKKKLNNRINEINSLDRLQLRELKRKLRKLGNKKGGGNIGLVQVSLLSKSILQADFFNTESENNYFFIISVKLQKK